jgi:pimeloyl-ACP methyl ester carboxylesterase
MSTRRHFDTIFDADYEDDENVTILQRNGSPTIVKKSNNTCRRLTITLVVLLVSFILISALLVLVWLVAGSWAFDQIFLCNPDVLEPDCAHNTYHNFTTWGKCDGISKPYSVDLSHLIVPLSNIESDVSFPSRDPFWLSKESATIRATFYNYDNMTIRPTIIVIHGYKDCRMATSSLIASGMLWRNGYNVLSIDLRNHGKSDYYKFQKPYTTFGSEEHKDVLGAWDYLVERYYNTTGQKLPQVGLYGVSMGGSTAIIAFAQNQNFTGLFVDSPPCDVYKTITNVISNEHHVNGNFIMTSSCATSRVESRYGCPPFQYDPRDSCATINRRVHIEWTKGDLIVPYWNLENVCLPTLLRAGANVTTNVMSSGKNTAFDACDDHTYNNLLNTNAYEIRLVNFFNENL